MSITELPTVDTFGGVKEALRTLAASSKRYSHSDANAQNDWLVKLATAIGLDDGSTSGSLREAATQLNDAVVDLQADVTDVQDTLSDIAAQLIPLGFDVQIVSTSTATITSARHVLVTYTGGTCTLTLPNAYAAREITIWKANTSSNTIILARSAGDTASGTINAVAASFTLTQGYYNDQEGARYDIVGQGTGAWWVNTEWVAIADLRTFINTIASGITTAIGKLTDAVVDATTTVTVAAGTRCLVLQNAGATINVTMPDASTSERFLIVKDNSATTQTINIIRSASDVTAAGTINGTAATYAVTWTGIPGTASRTSFSVIGTAAAAWVVDFGLWTAFAGLYSNFVTLSGYGNGAQTISGTSGTITTAYDVYLTNTGATLTITLPDAAAGRKIRLHKANSAATQTITLVRSTSDTSGGGTINGTAASFDIVLTSVSGTRRAYDVSSNAALTWEVDSGETVALTTNSANIATNTTDITSLKNGIVFNQQVVSGASATISAGTTHVYIDHAAARVDLTLPSTANRFAFTIIKRATSGSFYVRLIPASGSDAIQGLAAGTNLDIPGSNINASTTTNRPAFYVTSSASNVVDVA
jgi:hypothetical protein